GGGRVLTKRSTPFLPSLTGAPHMGAGAEDHILAAESDELRESQPRLHHDEEKRAIPAACPCALIGRGKEGLDLGPCEELDLRSMVALCRYREDTLGEGAVDRVVEGDVPEERMDRPQ